MKTLFYIVGLTVLLSGCEIDQPYSSSNDRDNTSVNDRDLDGDTVTPFDQSNTQADTELVAELRSGVLQIDNLSINGRNIKIITNDGRVLLRGIVESAAERDAILAVIHRIAGADNVSNQLEINND